MSPQSQINQQNTPSWLEKILENTKPIASHPTEKLLITTLLDAIYTDNSDEKTKRILIAAAFDLVVAAEYYRSVAHVGWLYCPNSAEIPLLIYPYTNVCSRCVLQGDFIYHSANKPKSGVIGAKTSRLLALFFQELFIRKGLSIEVLKGVEPVDIIFRDNNTNPITLFCAEIKAAPLLTLPLVVKSQQLTVDDETHNQVTAHRVTDNSNLFGSEIGLFVPIYNKETGIWQSQIFSLGTKQTKSDEYWAYQGLINLITSTPSFLKVYFEFWQVALASYGNRDQSPIYWFTNACGQPSPRPTDWPRRKGASGYESISDSKTSVGMDRTDDLKKATYQVLKIGAESKPNHTYACKVGIISNIQAIRHFDDYLGTLKDIVWAREPNVNVTKVKDLSPDTDLFNLFDGIVTLTETLARDAWIKTVFDF